MLVNIGFSKGEGIQTQLHPATGEGSSSLPITVSRRPRHCCQGCENRGKKLGICQNCPFWDFPFKFPSKGHQSGHHWQHCHNTDPNIATYDSATPLGSSHTKNRKFSLLTGGECCSSYLPPHAVQDHLISVEADF